MVSINGETNQSTCSNESNVGSSGLGDGLAGGRSVTGTEGVFPVSRAGTATRKATALLFNRDLQVVPRGKVRKPNFSFVDLHSKVLFDLVVEVNVGIIFTDID